MSDLPYRWIDGKLQQENPLDMGPELPPPDYDPDAEREAEITRLRAELARKEEECERLREALKRWENYGCPDCHGDCASANPPVSFCIMQETRSALTGAA